MSKPVCHAHQIQEEHSVVLTMLHVTPAGVSLDDVLEPSYWANTWKLFENRSNSTIQFIAEDNQWEARVRVLSAKGGVMKFRILSKFEEAVSLKEAVPEGYTVEHMTEKGWRVVDPAGSVIASEEARKSDALTIAVEHSDRVQNAKKASKKSAA